MEILVSILGFIIAIGILVTFHEFGHYYYAQKHNVDASLPYFIPAPPFVFLIGTFYQKNLFHKIGIYLEVYFSILRIFLQSYIQEYQSFQLYF